MGAFYDEPRIVNIRRCEELDRTVSSVLVLKKHVAPQPLWHIIWMDNEVLVFDEEGLLAAQSDLAVLEYDTSG